jgi:hypothetical protein
VREGGVFRSVGLGGGGWFYLGDPEVSAREQPAIAVESKLGFALSGGFSIFWALDLAVHDFETIDDCYHWLFQKDEYTALRLIFLWPLIVLAPFAGSHAVTGPGVSWHSSVSGPAFFADAGMGLSAFIRPSEGTFMAGTGFFAGFGVEIAGGWGFGVRALYSPPTLVNLFQGPDSHVVTVLGFANLVSW